ncbi:hypothetical protein [Streptomyces albogriseolus]|uniref:hypothetical protein n=1 Tax=Streptomyces albogriseolus TaxID=1887 RepID=UPI00380B1106
MSHIDWGSVPAWFSAVLTSGSLFLGFYIMLRDRRKEETAEARRLVFTCTSTGWMKWHITAQNTSDRPVTGLGMYPLGQQVFGQSVLLPGEMTTGEFSGESFQSLVALFADADGQAWARSLVTHELRRIPWEPTKQVKAVQRIYRRSSVDKLPPSLGSNH